MKCLKRKTPTGVEYDRVQEGEAHVLVARDGWQYCSKEEYKKNAGSLKQEPAK